MTTVSLIDALGYNHSRHFITPETARSLPASELTFAVRHTAEASKLLQSVFQGAYLLQDRPSAPAVPIVYVFEAESDAVAKDIHKMVWNQNLVPFLIVASPSTVRLYLAFGYSREEDEPLLSPMARNAADLLSHLRAFTANAIDDGEIWETWGYAINPNQRVDETLLRDLKLLDEVLQRDERMARDSSHGLIGKFVYLRYLRDRHILSDRKLEKWGIEPDAVFSRHATLKAFRLLDDELNDWLNGAVFQLADDAMASITQAQLRRVASVFSGDSPAGQLHFDFEAYDFSHIPIETLSCVYEQFLHDSVDQESLTRGERLGAYYTPVPLADFVISELERKRPLAEGMRLLDPSCGSGTFLVQCYRRLIEKKMRAQQRRLRATELRELLTEHIFGIDRDDDACRIAELSLLITLLDYVEPPDLENTSFKLPKLRGTNIFFDDFFDPAKHWRSSVGDQMFHWIVGNPPWSEVKGEPEPDDEHFYAWRWITQNKEAHPTGGNQIAEAFVWETAEHLTRAGISGLVVPAMTWFKKESQAFRQQFFVQHEAWCLANFANLAEVLFAGRARLPASVIFFKRTSPREEHTILTFAPFVAEQIANRPQGKKRRVSTWNIVLNASEVREVPNDLAIQGAALFWKLAMWGSGRDSRLLRRIANRFDSLKTFCEKTGLLMNEGFQLRPQGSREAVEYDPDLTEKLTLKPSSLRNVYAIFGFPPQALERIPADRSYIRKRGGKLGKEVSKPPHILVDASRRYAVFSSEFIAVPSRQIGIAGLTGSEDALRALSLYLSSDFCKYHQFFTSPQWGIAKSIADLDALRVLPVPLDNISSTELETWLQLHRELVALSEEQFRGIGRAVSNEERVQNLLNELNTRVFRLLGLRNNEIWLIDDFLRENLKLNQGKVANDLTRTPTSGEICAYLTALRNCLDDFLPADRGLHHKLEAIVSGQGAFFSVSLATEPVDPVILDADADSARALLEMRDALRQQRSQWVYFDRRFRAYRAGVLYQFKPMQRLHWTRRQAVIDSEEIIADTIAESESA